MAKSSQQDEKMVMSRDSVQPTTNAASQWGTGAHLSTSLASGPMSADPYESLTFGNSLSVRVDGAIGAMSLSPNGRDAVLAGRRGLFIIDLDDPFRTPRWLHHITSWEVADVQWSPHHAAKPSWCISTSNQKALLWDLARPSNNAVQNVLHRHTRAITDINFHPLDPELLATCSIDTFVLSWDMRTPRRPVGKWAEWRAGATQIKWNHSNPYQIASSHHHSFYLWDSRHGARPLLHLDNAHEGKINGLDFSGSHNKLMTCSNDKSVKYWDLNTSLSDGGLQPTVVIKTDYPVARARSLPFGNDHCCGIMPVRGGDNAVHVVNYEAVYQAARSLGETGVLDVTPDYSFKGHHGPIKDFLWRTRHEAYEGYDSKHSWKEYQLVTWSLHDYDLKLWPHDDALYRTVDYHPLHQKLLGPLADDGANGSNGGSADWSGQSTPVSEIEEPQAGAMKYNTYCMEPPLSLSDVSKDASGDLLSSLALIKIKQSQENSGGHSQLNHLTWISGVRMGRTGLENLALEKDDGPTNLGEEVSIVGHKFPKIRFEKISVSTGHLVMSLRGPLPTTKEDTGLQSSGPAKSAGERKDSVQESVSPSAVVSPNTTVANAGSALSSAVQTSSIHQPVSSGNTSSITQNIPTVPANLPATNIATTNVPASNIPLTNIPVVAAGPSTGPTRNPSLANGAALQAESQSNNDASSEQKLVFIRLDIRFPKMYPYLENTELKRKNSKKHKKGNEIKFDIEETHELTKPIKEEMLTTLNNIAFFYSNKYNKYCLEPCLRYLMGDKIELDDTLMLDAGSSGETRDISDLEMEVEVGAEDWVDDLINQHEAASTLVREMPNLAEEDDDEDYDLIPAVNDLSASHDLSRIRDDSNVSANDNLVGPDGNIKHDTTPLPKGCGAIWAPSGQLVCFFIPQREDNLLETRLARKLHMTRNGESLVVKTYSELELSDSQSSESEELESEDDRSSLTSNSSDDSLSHDWNEMLQDDIPSRSRVPGMFKGAVGIDRKFLRKENIKSSINRTFSGKEHGSNYKSSAYGDTSLRSTKRTKRDTKNVQNIVTVLDFSHLMPDKFELACEYRVLGDSPENLARYNSHVAFSKGYKELSDVWRIVEMILVKDVSPHDVPDIGKDVFFSEGDFKGRYFWGSHPFGHSWLIVKLFDYFEKAGNLQMLAMLSCILFENISNIRASENGDYKVPIHTPYSSLPPVPSVVNIKEYGVSVRESRASLAMGSMFSHPEAFDEFALSRKPSTLSAIADADAPTSVSNSMDNYSRSSSPHILSPFKKHYGSFVPLLESSVQWDHTPGKNNKWLEGSRRQSRLTLIRKEKNISTRRTHHNLTPGAGKPRPPPTFTVEMKNIHSLDLYEHVYSKSLLSELDENKIMGYRDQYADTLYLWGLPFNRIKILKFNYPEKDNRKSESAFDSHSCGYGFRPRKAMDPNQQLLSPLTPIPTAKHNSWNTRKRNKFQYCGLCGLVVSKRVVLCIHCEHVLHSECASSWWFTEKADEKEGNEDGSHDLQECPTGCGCNCLDYEI